MTGYGEAELNGGVGEVAGGPGDASGLFGEAGGIGERAAGGRDVLAGGADSLLDPPVRGIAPRVGVARPAAQLLGAGDIRAIGREHCADRQGERVARVLGRAGQL